MNEEFLFKLSDALKKIAPEFSMETYRAKLIPDKGVYAVTGGAVVDVEYYDANEVVERVANGHWIIVEENSISKTASITIVNSEDGDWSGLYVNKLLEYEGHNIATADWIDVIQKHRKFSGVVEIFEVSDEFINDRGNLPLSMSDIEGKYLYRMS